MTQTCSKRTKLRFTISLEKKVISSRDPGKGEFSYALSFTIITMLKINNL